MDRKRKNNWNDVGLRVCDLFWLSFGASFFLFAFLLTTALLGFTFVEAALP